MIKPTVIHGEAWIGKYFGSVTFIKAKDCDFNKEKYTEVLKNFVDEKPITQIEEGYMRYLPCYSEKYDAKGFWQATDKTGRGVTLFYFARTAFSYDDEMGVNK